MTYAGFTRRDAESAGERTGRSTLPTPGKQTLVDVQAADASPAEAAREAGDRYRSPADGGANAALPGGSARALLAASHATVQTVFGGIGGGARTPDGARAEGAAIGKRTRSEQLAPATGAAAPAGVRMPATGGGAPLPADARSRMEAVFGTDFSAVRVHEGEQAAAVGARAYAQGDQLHFAPGQYDPASAAGQELLGHELAHVVQQRGGGRASAPQAKGGNLYADAGLEAEADRAGAQAARGEPVGVLSHAPAGRIQRKTLYSEGFTDNDELMKVDQVLDAVMKDAGNEFFAAIGGDTYGPGTQLYLDVCNRGPEGRFGDTLLILVLDGELKSPKVMTEHDWTLVKPDTGIQLKIQVNVDKLGTLSQVTPGAKVGKNEVLNTLIHEFTLHAEPYRAVIEAIRGGKISGPELGAWVTAQLGPQGALNGKTQHEQLVAGTSASHTAATASAEKMLGYLKGHEDWSVGQFQQDVVLDRDTETLAYIRRTLNAWAAHLIPALGALASDRSQLPTVEAAMGQFQLFTQGNLALLMEMPARYEQAPGKDKIHATILALALDVNQAWEQASRMLEEARREPVGQGGMQVPQGLPGGHAPVGEGQLVGEDHVMSVEQPMDVGHAQGVGHAPQHGGVPPTSTTPQVMDPVMVFEQYLDYSTHPSRDVRTHLATLQYFAGALAPHRALHEALYLQILHDLKEAQWEYADYLEYVRD
jgi:Domain of unknown function (DUF4157)